MSAQGSECSLGRWRENTGNDLIKSGQLPAFRKAVKAEAVNGVAAPFFDKNMVGLRDVLTAGAKVRERAAGGGKPSKLGGV